MRQHLDQGLGNLLDGLALLRHRGQFHHGRHGVGHVRRDGNHDAAVVAVVVAVRIRNGAPTTFRGSHSLGFQIL